MNLDYLKPKLNEKGYVMNNGPCVEAPQATPRQRMTIARHKELTALAYEVELFMSKKLKISLNSDEVCQFGSLMQNLLMIRRDECQKIN